MLFLVEGFTDIRFVTGLSEICDLTMVVPATQYVDSDLKGRIARSGSRISVTEIPGDRFAFQIRSLHCLLKYARQFDVILAQEMLRGALNANIAGRLLSVPVVTCMTMAPAEYYRCRYERRQIGRLKALAGELALRSMLAINGRLCSCCLAMGPYLQKLASRYCRHTHSGLYYGIDTRSFRPLCTVDRADLRRRLDLPTDNFIVLFPSRISHEKDPETVLRAVAIARSKGLDAIVFNLGGGHRQFLEIAQAMELPDWGKWVVARPAVHPVTEVFDYYRAADLLAQASLEEGAGLAPLEALACGLPVVATAVGGMAILLREYAHLVPRRDASAMAEQILWSAANPERAKAQALLGRQFVAREWSRDKAFADLLQTLAEVSAHPV